ncbi:MAG: hypothetical protein P8P74_00555 [Crocinitomicaceae bacterium]|nr:hypothetical protein [Crocinitomicaceae bacterium]
MTNSRSPFVRFAFLITLLVLVGAGSGCEKYSSPNKVERHIVNGTWKLTSAFIDNVDVTTTYENYSFTFSQAGDVDVIGDETISGIWSTGIEKNPATLSLTLTPFDPFYHLNADWTVTTCKSDRMTLELRGSSAIDVLIISRL